MPDLSGLEVTRRIHQAVPETEVVILTILDSEPVIRHALSVGARGYVLKSNTARDLTAAVEMVGQHKYFLGSEVSDTLRRSYLTQSP